MDKLCKDNWFEIFKYLTHYDINNFRKTNLVNDETFKLYAELLVSKKYPSVYQALITYQNNWGKFFRSIISPFEDYYLSPIDSLDLYIELENYFINRMKYNDEEFEKEFKKTYRNRSEIIIENLHLIKLWFCQLTEINDDIIENWTCRSRCPRKFGKMICCLFLHDQRSNTKCVIERMIDRGYYDEVLDYYELNDLDISDDFILKAALKVHKGYKKRKELEASYAKESGYRGSYDPGIRHFCYQQYPTAFIYDLLSYDAVYNKIPDGLLDYLILTDAKLDIDEAKTLLKKEEFPYKKKAIFKNIIRYKDKELINLLLINPCFKSCLYNYLKKYSIDELLKYPIIRELEYIKNF